MSKIFHFKSHRNVNQVEHLVVLGTFLCLPTYNVNFQMKLWFLHFHSDFAKLFLLVKSVKIPSFQAAFNTGCS